MANTHHFTHFIHHGLVSHTHTHTHTHARTLFSPRRATTWTAPPLARSATGACARPAAGSAARPLTAAPAPPAARSTPPTAAVGSLTLASRAPVCPAWVKVRLPHLKPSPSMRRLLGRRASPPEGVGLMDLPLVSNQLDFLDLWAAVAGTVPLFSTAAFHKVYFFFSTFAERPI